MEKPRESDEDAGLEEHHRRYKAIVRFIVLDFFQKHATTEMEPPPYVKRYFSREAFRASFPDPRKREKMLQDRETKQGQRRERMQHVREWIRWKLGSDEAGRGED